jgi:hypothetical protein
VGYISDQSKPQWEVIARVKAESSKEAKKELGIRWLCGNERVRRVEG